VDESSRHASSQVKLPGVRSTKLEAGPFPLIGGEMGCLLGCAALKPVVAIFTGSSVNERVPVDKWLEVIGITTPPQATGYPPATQVLKTSFHGGICQCRLGANFPAIAPHGVNPSIVHTKSGCKLDSKSGKN